MKCPVGDAPMAYTLISGTTVTGITNTASAVISGSAESYQATVAASGPQQFYRIKRWEIANRAIPEIYLISVRNGVAGRPSLLKRFTSGVFAQP